MCGVQANNRKFRLLNVEFRSVSATTAPTMILISQMHTRSRLVRICSPQFKTVRCGGRRKEEEVEEEGWPPVKVKQI